MVHVYMYYVTFCMIDIGNMLVLIIVSDQFLNYRKQVYVTDI